LINDPASYIYCHYLPECYSAIAAYTPRTVWFHGTTIDMDRVLDLVRPFGDAPLMVKDFVKSRKHEWQEACYIPSATDRAAVTRVVSRFLELQGEDLAEGLVFRQFIDFEPIGSHAVSGMPLIKEYRVFFLDSVPIVIAPYWEDGDYGLDAPPIEPFLAIARAIPSRLFTMDLAKRRDGAWMIVELGDGQVAGLPDSLDVRMFYQAIRQGLNLQPRQASGD
jgi:hypothetical protein